MGRLSLAFRCFFRVLGGKPVPQEAIALGGGTPSALPAASAEDQTTAHQLQLLGLLQREGRLLDFLKETIDDYDDQQIGAAVRAIHGDCRRVLDEYLAVEPVVDALEESRHSVPPGFDPAQIRLVGNVVGDPPFEGTLRHHGWRATRVRLPTIGQQGDSTVIAPAEVEI
ncbi:MAG: DUF2760 domain-containing protein [Deltaproteobacteria bacterium]|nr:DUF2760 domain-containing protein [Deltaproteobacteria bacterium]